MATRKTIDEINRKYTRNSIEDINRKYTKAPEAMSPSAPLMASATPVKRKSIEEINQGYTVPKKSTAAAVPSSVQAEEKKLPGVEETGALLPPTKKKPVVSDDINTTAATVRPGVWSDGSTRVDRDAIVNDERVVADLLKELRRQERTVKNSIALVEANAEDPYSYGDKAAMGATVERKKAELADLQARIANAEAKKKALDDEGKKAGYYYYETFRAADDFADKSQYVSTQKKQLTTADRMKDSTYSGVAFEDAAYDYINKNELAATLTADPILTLTGTDAGERMEMTEDEIALFNYLYAKDSEAGDAEHQNAWAYIRYLTSDLNLRERQKRAAEAKEKATKSGWAAVGESAKTVLASPMKAPAAVYQGVLTLMGEEIDPNDSAFQYSHYISDVRGAVSDQIAASGRWGPVGSFAYQIGMSMADSLYATLITGGFALKGTSLQKAATSTSLAIMGAGATADTTLEAIRRGLPQEQAFALGVSAGFAEILTEKVSIEGLLNGKWDQGFFRQVFKQMLAEGSEEAASEIINIMADTMISRDKSHWQAAIDAYMANGMSEKEAFRAAWLDQFKQVGLSALGGALSGGVSSTVVGGIGKGLHAIGQRMDYGKPIKNKKSTAGKAEGAVQLEQTEQERIGQIEQVGQNEPTAEQMAEQMTEDAADASVAEEEDAFHDRLVEQLQNGEIDEAEFDRQFDEHYRSERYSIDPGYTWNIDRWNSSGRQDGEVFTLGMTGDVLQGLGAMEQEIFLRSDKANKIMQDHPEMTISEIKRIPEILDDPVLILKSRNTGRNQADNSRVVVFGSVTAQNGKPALAVLDLLPIENGFHINDLQKVNSAYTRENAAGFFAGSEVLFADEKRTIPLLRRSGFALSTQELLRSGSVGSIAYSGGKVKMAGIPFEEIVGTSENSGASPTVTIEDWQDPVTRNKGAAPTAWEASLEERMRRAEPGSTAWSGARYGASEGDVKLAETWGKIFRKNVQFYRGGSENGKYDRATNTVYINVRSEQRIGWIFGHELTHSTWLGGVYKKALDRFVLKQIKRSGVSVEGLVKDKIELYSENGITLTLAEAREEVVCDWCADNLFDSAEHIEALANTDLTLADKVRGLIDRMLAPFSGDAAARASLERALRLYQKALAKADKVRAKGESGGGVRNNSARYSLHPTAVENIEKALADKNYTEDVYLTQNSPSIIVSQNGARDLPMLMKASHIRENVFTEAEAEQVGLKVNKYINYHGLGKELFKKIIGGLDDVTLAYRGTKNAKDPSRRENYFLLISQYKDAEGNTINVPVYINETGQYNRVFIDTNKIATAFGRKDFNQYIARELQSGNLVRIKNKGAKASELTSPINASYSENASDISIPQDRQDVNWKFSFSDTADVTTEQEAPAASPRDNLTKKEQTYLRSAENRLLGGMTKALGESGGGVRRSILETFSDEVRQWYDSTKSAQRVVSPGYFKIGTTSKALQSIGVREGNIYWRKSKIGTILEDHAGMDIGAIEHVPEILENPIIVMKSRTRNDSIVLFGDVYTESGTRVMAALNLTPKATGSMEAEFSLISSAYERAGRNIQNLLQNSEILYIDVNKKRADRWLMQLGVQFPSRQPVNGSIGSISYSDGNVNISGKTFRELGGQIVSEPKFSFSDTNNADTEQEAPAASPRDNLTNREQTYLRSAENRLLGGMTKALGASKFSDRSFMREAVRAVSDEYLRTGKVSQETVSKLFDTAHEQGTVVDRAFYDENKHIKDHLRRTAVTVSDRDKADIADYELFRKRAFGTLKIVGDGGLGVDVAYAELSDMAPNLFPADITHPADQLQQMYEVGKSIQVIEYGLDAAAGPNAEEFKAFAKMEFEAAVSDAVSEMNLVKRMENERAEKAQLPVPDELDTMDAVEAAYAELKEVRRAYDKALAKNLLTESDKKKVGQLIRGDITLELLDPAKDNVKGITAVYEAQIEYERVAKVIREWNIKRKAGLRAQADSYLETANDWKDKAAGILYSRETMERNIRYIVKDKKVAKAIIDEYFKPVHDGAAAANRLKNEMRDRVDAMHLSTAETKHMRDNGLVCEAHAVQLLGEALDNIRILENQRGRNKWRDGKTLDEWKKVVDDLWAQNTHLNKPRIERAVVEFRAIYDELFAAMNKARIRNGYEPVNYRSGYFPHFQPGGDGLMERFGEALGISTEVTALPTSINGLTHTFKPGIQWFGNAKERLGFDTAYNAVEGFDKYIEGVADVICQTDNIQKLRALASQIRYRTTDDGIREQVDAVMVDERLTEEEKQDRIDKIYEGGKFSLSNFVVELEEYTNLLANKKSRHDRNMEQAMGRRMYNIVKGLEGRVAANMVAINPASWLTNFVPLTQGGAQLHRGELLNAMWQTLRAYKESDGIVEMSSFLTNRRGSDPLIKTWAQKASGTLSKPMEYIDCFTADSLVRARYNQNLKKGMSQEAAMSEADSWAADVMADRSKGSMPTLFNRSNPITKVFTQFQLEVNNQLSYLFKDIPREAKEKGLAALIAALFKFFLGAYLYNEVYEFFIGRRPALDPIGILNDTVGDFTGYELPNLVELGVGVFTGNMPSFETERAGTEQAVTNLFGNVAEELPFIGGILGGGRVPISSALPDAGNLLKAATSDDWSTEKKLSTAAKELGKPATYLVLPFGGGQLKKIAEGLKAVIEGGSYTVNGKGERQLQYPVYNDKAGDAILSGLGATVFGKTSLPTGRDWIESGFKSLSVKETAAYDAMTAAGVNDRKAYALIRKVKGAEKTASSSAAAIKRQILRESDVSGDGKALLYYSMMASDTERLAMDQMLERGVNMAEVLDSLMDAKDSERGHVNWKRAAQAQLRMEDKMELLSYLVPFGIYEKVEIANKFSVAPDLYAGAMEEMFKHDANDNGSYSAKEIEAAIDAYSRTTSLSVEKKAALWQLLGSSSSAKKNPYSVEVGERVLAELDKVRGE